MHSSTEAIIGFIALVIGYMIYLLLIPVNIYLNTSVSRVLDALDYLFIAALVYLSGGLNSFFHFGYLIPILAATVRYGFKTGIWYTIFAAAITGLMYFAGTSVAFPIAFYVVTGFGTLVFVIWMVSVLVYEELHLRKEMYATSVTDPLTGLYHSGYLRERVNEEIKACRRENGQFAIAFLDLNNFKKVNDHYGHLVGDRVLKHMANILSGSVRGGETLARYGGDEFLLLLPGADREQAERALKRLQNVIELNPFVFDNKPLDVKISGGIAVFPTDGKNLEKLLLVADQRMYAAKKK